MAIEKKGGVKILILAGGKGTRMESDLPKVLMPLKGRSLITPLLLSVEKSDIDPRPTIVVGYEKELLMQTLGDKYNYVIQEEQLGTGHAVLSTENNLKNAEQIIVLQGDQPFTTAESIEKLVAAHLNSHAKITIATTKVPDFNEWRSAFIRFGRIIRKNGEIIDREYKDASEEEKNIKELNAGFYMFEAKWLWENLKKIENNNSQKEYYLTDLFEIAAKDAVKIETIEIDSREALAANSKEELKILEGLTGGV